jgi:hypothetical protein
MLRDDVHLVDADGYDVPVTEKDGVPHDPTDPACWPDWTDNWHWTISPEVDDAPADDQPEERCSPPRRQVSPDELAQIAAHGCV